MAARLRISIKWKIFALITLIISSALIVVIFRTSQIFREDKEAFVKELSAKLTSSTAKNVTNLISTLQDKLIIFISSRESLSRTGAKVDDQVHVLFSRYQEFVSIGFLKESSPSTLVQQWFLRNPDGKAAQWPTDFEKDFLSKLDVNRGGINGRALWRMQAPDGTWHPVLGFSVNIADTKKKAADTGISKAWIVGILPANTFADLLSDFSTGLNTGLIVDSDGFAVGNSDRLSLWKNYSKHPLVQEALLHSRPAGTGDFNDLDGRQVIGSFENIAGINLSAVVTTPRDKAFEAAKVMSRNIIFIGIVILFLALALAILLSNFMTGPLERLANVAAQIGGGNFKVPVDVESNDEIGDLAGSFQKMGQGLQDRDEALAQAQTALVQSEKMGAFGQLSAGIAHEVKNPLAGILGHAQLAMGKATSDDMKKHLEVIEKETRRCKAIVDNLMKFARQEKADMGPTDLAQVVQDTINLVDHQLSLAGCKIFKDIKPVPMVNANANQLQQVLLNLMVNASHAVENSLTKNVTVRVLQVGKKAQIQIEDTGIGIPVDIQKKIFEPFFTTKPAGKGTGLGLSVSIGIAKDHKGDIYLKSELNKGTTFFIDIPIGDDAVVSKKPFEKAPQGKGQAITQDPAPKSERIDNSKVQTASTSTPQPPIAAVKTYTLPSDEPVFKKSSKKTEQPENSVNRDTKGEDSAGANLSNTSKTPKSPEPPKTPKSSKTSYEPKPNRDDVFFGTQSNIVIKEVRSDDMSGTLGGKLPVDSGKGLPDLPKEDGGATSFFTKTEYSPNKEGQNPAEMPAAPEGSGEFRVKIKRPKLKI